MIGTLYNTSTILIGSAAGSLFRKSIGEKQQKVLFDARDWPRQGSVSIPSFPICRAANIRYCSSSAWPLEV